MVPNDVVLFPNCVEFMLAVAPVVGAGRRIYQSSCVHACVFVCSIYFDFDCSY